MVILRKYGKLDCQNSNYFIQLQGFAVACFGCNL